MLNLLPSGALSRIAVVAGKGAVRIAENLAKQHPETEIVVWGDSAAASQYSNLSVFEVEGVREMLVTLMGGGKVQAILDTTGDRTTFKNMFMTLTEGGRYVLTDIRRGSVGAYAATLMTAKMGGFVVASDERNLADAISELRFDGSACSIEKANHHLYKVRDETGNTILLGPAHRDQVEILATIPGGRFENRASIQTNNASLQSKRNPIGIEYPALSLRAYLNVACYPGQVYCMRDLVLPDTFRQIRGHRLTTRSMADTAQWHATAPSKPTIKLAGTYYALDNEVPGHFGHFTSEVLARVWGWKQAKSEYPQTKALISITPGESQLATWQIDLLAAAGISSSDIQEFDGPVLVERLIGATPMLSNPKYIHEGVTDIWKSVGKNLIDTSFGDKKIFVSRKPQLGRGCSNSREVEDYFRGKGFTIVYPEDHSASEQASLFNNAETIAGFAGSGMFSLIFAQEPKKVILIGSESYDAINEILFMAAAGGDLTYLWCTPSVPMSDTWTLESFQSDYNFNFERDGQRLEDAIC